METIMMRMLSTIVPMLTSPSLLWINQAQASQGPGVNPGSASATTQIAMAIVIYGGSALLIAAGLIGAARQRSSRG
jgi:hypothetical protein